MNGRASPCGGTLDFGGGDCALSTLSGGNGGTLANVGTLTVSDGVTFAVQDGRVDALTVGGNLTLGSQAVATFLNGETLAAPPSVQKALEVTGEVTGDFAEVRGLPRKWTWSRVGKIWSVCKSGLLLIFR